MGRILVVAVGMGQISEF